MMKVYSKMSAACVSYVSSFVNNLLFPGIRCVPCCMERPPGNERRIFRTRMGRGKTHAGALRSRSEGASD